MQKHAREDTPLFADPSKMKVTAGEEVVFINDVKSTN